MKRDGCARGVMQFFMHRCRASGFDRRIPRWILCLKVDAFLRPSWCSFQEPQRLQKSISLYDHFVQVWTAVHDLWGLESVKPLSGCRNGSSKGLKFERHVKRERSGRDLSRGPKQHFLLPGTCGINHVPLVQVHSKPGEKRVPAGRNAGF